MAADERGHERLLAWARSLGPERRFALEDCRHVSGRLERFLIAAGEGCVRVPPKLMAQVRRSARSRGKSDAIDAAAIARAALREPGLPEARLDGPERELRLLADHRDDLVAERTRIQSRLRWHLHDLALDLAVPAKALDRACWLARLEEALAELDGVQPGIARELTLRCRALSAEIAALGREIARLAPPSSRPSSSRCPAAAPSPPPACSARRPAPGASPARRASPCTPASRPCRSRAAGATATG